MYAGNGTKGARMRFQCQESCGGRCCKGPEGFVFLTIDDIERLEKALGRPRDTFAKIGVFDSVFFTDQKNVRAWYLNSAGKQCQFLVNGKCSVYPARPMQCRTYPFWPTLKDKKAWHAEKAKCPGIDKGPHRDDAQVLMVDQKRAERMIPLRDV